VLGIPRDNVTDFRSEPPSLSGQLAQLCRSGGVAALGEPPQFVEVLTFGRQLDEFVDGIPVTVRNAST
jgi:hypothetical protein